MEELINIHTRKVADRNINAYEGYEIGLKIIESMTGDDIKKLIFKKKNRAVIMKSEPSIEIDNEKIVGHPMLLFQPLIFSVQGIDCDVDAEAAFWYELYTLLLALSDKKWLLTRS